MINKIKREATDWEVIFTILISDIGLILEYIKEKNKTSISQ